MKVPEPIITDLTPLNHATTLRCDECRANGGHYPSLTVLTRATSKDGFGLFVVCSRCAVPYLVSAQKWVGRLEKAEVAA